jgi:guanylate kinase
VTQGVILYGPPASGKDTITAALHTLDPTYVLFPRLKAGPGRTIGYRLTNPQTLDKLAQAGEIVFENTRYNSRYAIDRPELLRRLERHVPVVHLGQVEAVAAVKAAAPLTRWLVVSLWCPREVAATRIVDRGTGDADYRLQAWDTTEELNTADLHINTAVLPPEAAARTVDQQVKQRAS